MGTRERRSGLFGHAKYSDTIIRNIPESVRKAVREVIAAIVDPLLANTRAISGRKRSHRDLTNLEQMQSHQNECIERLVLEVKPSSRLPTSSWKALIQARLYVAEYGGPFRLVMGEVFELSTNSSDPPLELRIDQKIFAIKLEMRYINECYREMPLFKDGDLEVFATKYDPEPFAWIHRALLVLYTQK